MDKEFRTMLPHKFVKNTIALCGERGKIWLETLPQNCILAYMYRMEPSQNHGRGSQEPESSQKMDPDDAR